MIDLATLPLYLSLPAGFFGGLFVGFGYFLALRATADLIVKEGHPAMGIALTLGRLSLLASGFFIAVLAGGFALIAALVGLLCAKAVLLHRIARDEV